MERLVIPKLVSFGEGVADLLFRRSFCSSPGGGFEGAAGWSQRGGPDQERVILVVLAVCYLPARRAVHLGPTAAIRQD